MNRRLFVILCGVLIFSGCATLGDKLFSGADRTVQQFFTDLERNDRQAAYNLFGKGLSQKVSFDQFDQLIADFQERWGRIESEETALMPFHERQGEQNFIPLNTKEEQIKRYTYDVKFSNAGINFDLTLVPDGQQYKIVWFSFWGSTVYLTPDVTKKISQLFNKSEPSDQYRE